MKTQKKSVNTQVEDIECTIWNLQADLINSGLIFSNDRVIKALAKAGRALLDYRVDVTEKVA